MTIDSAASAAEFVRIWNSPDPRCGWKGKSSSNVSRFRDEAKNHAGIALLCGDRLPSERDGHLAAARVLQDAADDLEAELNSPRT